MSRSDWLSYAALAGLIIVICLGSYLSPWIARIIPGHAYSVANTQNTAGQDKGARATAAQNEKHPPSGEHENPCHNGENSDLCAQLRMADAAEVQSRLNLVGIILVAFSLFFTGWAAAAASKAAAETSNATKLMRLEQRPWLDMEFATFEKLMLEKKKVSLADISISNTGNSIAFNYRVFAQLYVGGSKNHEANRKELMDRLRNWKHPGFSIMPGKTIPHTEPIFCPEEIVASAQPESFSVCFVIRYSDYEGKNEFFTSKNFMLISRDNMMMFTPSDAPFRNVRAIADDNRTTYE